MGSHGCSLQFSIQGLPRTDGVAREWPDEPAQGNQGKRVFVCPPDADVIAGPEFRDEFPDPGSISLGVGEFLKGRS